MFNGLIVPNNLSNYASFYQLSKKINVFSKTQSIAIVLALFVLYKVANPLATHIQAKLRIQFSPKNNISSEKVVEVAKGVLTIKESPDLLETSTSENPNLQGAPTSEVSGPLQKTSTSENSNLLDLTSTLEVSRLLTQKINDLKRDTETKKSQELICQVKSMPLLLTDKELNAF